MSLLVGLNVVNVKGLGSIHKKKTEKIMATLLITMGFSTAKSHLAEKTYCFSGVDPEKTAGR